MIIQVSEDLCVDYTNKIIPSRFDNGNSMFQAGYNCGRNNDWSHYDQDDYPHNNTNKKRLESIIKYEDMAGMGELFNGTNNKKNIIDLKALKSKYLSIQSYNNGYNYDNLQLEDIGIDLNEDEYGEDIDVSSNSFLIGRNSFIDYLSNFIKFASGKTMNECESKYNRDEITFYTDLLYEEGYINWKAMDNYKIDVLNEFDIKYISEEEKTGMFMEYIRYINMRNNCEKMFGGS